MIGAEYVPQSVYLHVVFKEISKNTTCMGLSPVLCGTEKQKMHCKHQISKVLQFISMRLCNCDNLFILVPDIALGPKCLRTEPVCIFMGFNHLIRLQLR